MIELKVMDKPYWCRTKELLWFQEMKQTITMLRGDGKTMQDILAGISQDNLFNSVSKDRAKEIGRAVAKRIAAVDESYLRLFDSQSIEMQKILSVVCIMLEDHTFFEFMDLIYREKLVINDMDLKDADIIGYIHGLQSRNEKAAFWTDAGIKKLRDNIKAVLRDGGMISKQGEPRKILKPIMTKEVDDYFKENGLDRIRKILAGER